MKRKVQQGKQFFCTECGSALDDFCIEHKTREYADVLKHHFECQRTGKFKGSMCSKLFIADGGTAGGTRKKSRLSSKKLAHLKSSILHKIEKDQAKRI